MKELLQSLADYYQEWKDARFLKRHDCNTWDEYRHRFDDGVNKRASTVDTYYPGYKFVFCFDQQTNYAYKLLYDYGPGGTRYGYHEIIDWCKINIKQKHRTDIHRVIKHNGIGLDGSVHDQWWFNELGGSDLLFFAFQNERDYVWFTLRWGA